MYVDVVERMPMALLTPHQSQVLHLLAEGESNRTIAKALGVSPSAIANSIYAIYTRIGVENRVQAALWYTEHQQSPEPEAVA
jgi:DNA-binding NarL/FixJ family response regulator